MHVIAAALGLICLVDLRGQNTSELVATVRNVEMSASQESENDPKFDAPFLRFEATLHNSTNQQLAVAPEPVVLTYAEGRSETGEWKTLFTSSWYDKGSVKYQACSKVKPGADYVFQEIATDVIPRKDDKPFILR